MSLKMKLVSMVSAFVLVIGMLLIGVFAVERVQVDMGGSITFNADDVYARVTGSVANAQVAPASLNVTYSAYETIGNPTAWESLDLEFDSYATPIVISITVENLSTERSLTVNLTDTLTSSVPNLGKALQRDNGAYTSGTNIPLDPKDNGTDTTTFTITLSVTDKNQSLTNAQFDYDLNLYDESVAPKEILEGFIFDDSGNLTSYTGTDSEVTVPSSYSMIGEPTTKSLYFETVDSTEEYMMTLINITNFKLTTDDGEEYIFDDFEEVALSSDYVNYFPCTLEYKDYSNVTFTTGSDYQVEGVVGAFAFNQTIQTVNLPDSIKNIGLYSFASSTLKELTLPSSLTSIGSNAFRDCSGLTGKLNLGECTSLTSIGDRAFRDCSGLTSLTLPSSLTSIGDYAFNYCSGLTSVDLSGCTSLTSIGIWAFRDCSGLKSVDLRGCTSLTSIEDDAFYGCTKLTSVDLSGCTSLTSIGIWAFYGCSGLTSISLPSSLTSIGSSAFRDCRGLTSLDLSGCTSLTRIESYAFEGCSALTSVTFGNTSGWYVTQDASATSGKEVDVSLPSTNASNLTGQYSDYYWKRNV